MELVTGAMGSLLPKLLDLVKDEYKLQKNLKSEIQSLYKELEAMQAALYDVAKLEPHQRDKRLNLWTSEVWDLSYDAEDILDSLPSRVGIFSRGRHEIADKINEIQKKTKQVAARRERYNMDARTVVANPATTGVDRRFLALYKDAKEIVGIEAPRNDVLRKLGHGSGSRLKIVSIVGIGGLGKTTLAKAVYDKFVGRFDCTAFVSVSRNPDIKKVLRDILLEIDKQKYMSLDGALWDKAQLIKEVRTQLAHKRYLIVVDDIWDSQSWDDIKCALIDSKCGSRVVTTTRNINIAEKTGDVYKLKPLSDQHSEALFDRRRFFDQVAAPSVLPKVPKKILEKCGGVPLAIITMASLLAEKPPNDWSKVYERIGFGSEVDTNDYVKNTRMILRFSYYDLPYHLRACFLHLAIFPEDYVIKKETLIWKWAAEGFIAEKQEMGLFQLGETYFNELMNRNVIMPVEDDSHGGIIIGCRVHDLFLDIIYSESAAANFVVVLDGSKPDLILESKARRLAVQKRAAERDNFLANTSQEKLRTFSGIMCEFGSKVSLSGFKVLRVLAIEECTFKEVGKYPLKHIGALVQLRYLGLCNTPIDKLPDEIGDLTLLQTLDLRGTKLKSLPRRVSGLKQLKCLRTDYTIPVPDWIGKLTSLEELRLNGVSKSVNFVEELGKLTEMRELQIWIEESDETNKALFKSMGNLQKIQVLGLMSYSPGKEANWEGYEPPKNLTELRLNIGLSRLPVWIDTSLVPVLSHLSVEVKALEEKDMDILGALLQLISLELLMPSNLSLRINGGGAFPKLRCFETSAPFRFLPGAMPTLESLRFKINVQALMLAGFEFDFDTSRNLPLLQKVEVDISSKGILQDYTLEAEAAINRAVEAHTSAPTIKINKTNI